MVSNRGVQVVHFDVNLGGVSVENHTYSISPVDFRLR